MREINLKLWFNDEYRDWSIEIDGRIHDHIAGEGLTELVEGALIVAAKSLIQGRSTLEHSKVREAITPGGEHGNERLFAAERSFGQ
jgi:hypothetical protein